MRAARRVVRFAVHGWLAIQLLASTAAPLVMCAQQPSAARGAHACCPGVGPGQVCPMHHTREGASKCALSAACGSSDAALLSLLIAPGVAPPPVTSAAIQPAERFTLSSELPIDRATVPDAPPPRS